MKGKLGEEWKSLLSGKKMAVAADVALILVLGLSVAVILTLFIDRLPTHINVGEVAAHNIKADANYEIVDEVSTGKLKESAAQSVLPVYDYDPFIESETLARIKDAFEYGRAWVEAPKDKPLGADEAQLKSDFFKKLEINLTDSQYDLLRHFKFHPAIEKAFVTLAHNALQVPTIHDLNDLENLETRGFILRQLVPGETYPEELVNAPARVQDLEGARKSIEQVTFKDFAPPLNLEFIGEGPFNLLKDAALPFLRINTTLNGLETDERKKRAMGNIKNIIIKVQSGESIIRSGDRFEPWHVTVLSGIQKEKLKVNRSLKFLGVFLFVNLFLIIVYTFATKYIRKFHPNRKDLVFLGVNLIVFLLLLRLGAFVGASLTDAFSVPLEATTFYYAIPIAAGAMIVRFILNSEVAFVFAVILSVLSGLYLESSLEMMVYYLISGVFAAHVIAHANKRSTVLLCGLQTGMVCALTIFSLNLISLVSISSSRLDSTTLLINMLSGIMAGINTSIIVLVASPLMEALFKYTTDIQLLEMANLSHPLLREMIVRAPGTYHHSQIVGILSEAAAQEISANPLLARVGSYYHDIGKMKKPQYFIENQKGGENPHDRLNPSMSALIIEAHVRDGLDLAREHKLPKVIADMIPQHQGTKLIGFFYNKAKKVHDPALGKVDERDYRYPGPKPQTREAGIIMLADTIEAAVRAQADKSPGKIQQTVEKLVNQHFVDEQLDECDLTLRDLHRIAGAFVKILIGIYHQRIEYPEGALVGETTSSGNEMPEVSYLGKKGEHAYPVEPASHFSNVAPLFRKKDQDDS